MLSFLKTIFRLFLFVFIAGFCLTIFIIVFYSINLPDVKTLRNYQPDLVSKIYADDGQLLEEYADEYFRGPMNRYMQFVAKAKHDYKSVTHVDGTARVQLVEKTNTSILRKILEEWYDKTGVPMLLNTSLNIKGQPMVDNWQDAKEFMEKYNVRVF